VTVQQGSVTAPRNVLIVHYHFLPVHNVAVKRLVAYAERLPRYGWQPIVLTRDWQGTEDQDASWGLSWEPQIERRIRFPIHRVHGPPPLRAWSATKRVPRPMRQAVKLARVLCGDYPDGFVRWVRPAVAAARTLARGTPIDAVITYCPPETNHLVGQRLARALRVPWIPFFGDLWEFFLAPFPSTPDAVLRKLYHRLWMAPAAACAAVSPYMAQYLERTYGKRAEVILTGFDPADFADASRHNGVRRERLVLSHIGSLYPLDQQPHIFFDGLDELLRRHPEVESGLEVAFVGSKCDTYLSELIRNRPCARVCSIVPKVDSATALSLVKSSDGLLAFNCAMHRERHGTMSYPTKIFEAFGARRPVLAMPPDGDWVDTLLARTGAGTSAKDAPEVADVLWNWYTSWQDTGGIAYGGREDALDALTVERQTERLAALLDSVAHRPPAAKEARS
jgi:glycosyltransferase involved in cell wall biosynthesis